MEHISDRDSIDSDVSEASDVDLMQQIERWDGEDIGEHFPLPSVQRALISSVELDDMLFKIRSAFDSKDHDRVVESCEALLFYPETQLTPFYRARLNMYLALTPLEVGEDHRKTKDRLELAAIWVQEAADRQDPTGQGVSDSVKSWKQDISNALRDIEVEPFFYMYPPTSLDGAAEDEKGKHLAHDELATALGRPRKEAVAKEEEKWQEYDKNSGFRLGVGRETMLRKSFGRPSQQQRGSLFDLLSNEDSVKTEGEDKPVEEDAVE